MKNWKKAMAILISAIVLFCDFGINTFAAETEASSQIKVYDSQGNLIDELDSMDELIKYGINTKTRGREELMRLLYDVLKGLVVHYLVQGITNAFDYLSNYKITIPTVNPGDIITVYSLDGNIYNPYPPNSYQGVTWVKTNFLVVVS